MTINANYIFSYLSSRGWTKNAICGMLGNLQTESTINPGIWQGLHQGNMSGGFGLVQWTPASKYIDWATGDYTTMDNNLKRILYEVSNNVQWISTSKFPMSFSQFTKSTQTPEYLAEAFITNYERPADPTQPIRGTQARYWWDTVQGGSGGSQLAQFPMDIINITQGENGDFSHAGRLAIDFVGTHSKYPYYAPVDCTVTGRIDSEAMMVFKSDKEVMCADGNMRSITWWNIHEEPLVFPIGKKLKKGEHMGYSGVGAFATGDHYHLQVFDTISGVALHIFDVFAVNGVNIVNGNGYPWRTSEYVDGGGEVPEAETGSNEIYHLLLSGAMPW